MITPILAEIAIEYLVISPTSSAIERAFSAAGNIITSKRPSLKPSTAKALLTLKLNGKS